MNHVLALLLQHIPPRNVGHIAEACAHGIMVVPEVVNLLNVEQNSLRRTSSEHPPGWDWYLVVEPIGTQVAINCGSEVAILNIEMDIRQGSHISPEFLRPASSSQGISPIPHNLSTPFFPLRKTEVRLAPRTVWRWVQQVPL